MSVHHVMRGASERGTPGQAKDVTTTKETTFEVLVMETADRRPENQDAMAALGPHCLRYHACHWRFEQRGLVNASGPHIAMVKRDWKSLNRSNKAVYEYVNCATFMPRSRFSSTKISLASIYS
jgi:hypothetical protein